MRNIFSQRSRRALAACAITLIVTLGTPTAARAESLPNFFMRVFGLTDDGRLVVFFAGLPQLAREIGYVSGLSGADTALIGIDVRVQNGGLYGVGNGGGVYTIDTNTGQASFVNALTVRLDGTRFGVDFNPAADRLRIISDTGQNLAHNVNLGGVTASNGTLTYVAPPAAAVAATGLTGAAYTNNDLNQPDTATTLFDIDTMLDQVVIQSPPGNGILVATGKLGFDAGPQVGFDIVSNLSGSITTDNRAFASLVVGGRSRLFRIDLLTGRATFVGSFRDLIVDIAIPLDQ